MPEVDLSAQRSLLLSALFRFSPEVQSIRDDAIDRIVEQLLLAADKDEGVNQHEILDRQQLCLGAETPVLSAPMLRASLQRLLVSGRATAVRGLFEDSYRLGEQARTQLRQLQAQADHCFQTLVQRLFKYGEPPVAKYSAPFLECLCTLFSRLGEAYVRVLRGEARITQVVGPHTITAAISAVREKYPSLDAVLIRSALTTFFTEEDPDSVHIKWNLAQNYYVAKALGLDPSGTLLSRQILAGAEFYLDTNIIIPALEPRAQHYHSVRALAAACRHLGVPLKVCQISVDQLRRVTQSHIDALPKVIPQIPDATAHKMPNVFLQMYREAADASGSVECNALFARFFSPMAELEGAYGMELVDDPWFVTAPDNPEVGGVAQAFNASLVERGRQPKKPGSVLHDTMLALWVKREREAGSPNAWLITLDSSFSDTSWVPGAGRPIAITLDALLHWLSPLVTDETDAFETSYAEAVKYLLLPQENFFEPRDFLIFAEMEWACRQLPPEDVEGCIRFLKTTLPAVDASTPAGREILSHHARKFFLDPGRKHQEVVAGLREEKERLTKEYESRLQAEIAAREEQTGQLRKQIEEQARRSGDEILALHKRLGEKEESERRSAARKAAATRLCGAVMLGLVIEASVLLIASRFGAGQNLFQKAVSFWPLFVACFFLALFVGKTLVGREGLKALGWPFHRD